MTRAMKAATLLLGLGMAVILCICKSSFSLYVIMCVRLMTHIKFVVKLYASFFLHLENSKDQHADVGADTGFPD